MGELVEDIKLALGGREQIVTDGGAVTRSPPGQVDGQEPFFFNGATLQDIRAPSFVTPGQTFTIRGEIRFDCITCAVGRACRAVLEGPQTDRIDEVGTLSNGETASFSFTVQAPQAEGLRTFRLEGQRDPPGPATWATDDVTTIDIDVVGEDERTGRQVGQLINDWGPWVGAGALAGTGYGSITEAEGQRTAQLALAGGSFGAGAKLATDSLGNLDLQFPLIPVAVTSAGVIGLAVLSENLSLDQFTGAAGDVTESVTERVTQ